MFVVRVEVARPNCETSEGCAGLAEPSLKFAF